MRKLSHKAAVSTLRDIVTEGEAYASSGDARLAAEGRRNALFAQIILQLISAVPADAFASFKVATTSKNDAAEIDKELADAVNNNDAHEEE